MVAAKPGVFDNHHSSDKARRFVNFFPAFKKSLLLPRQRTADFKQHIVVPLFFDVEAKPFR
jgi:hypothetical protein